MALQGQPGHWAHKASGHMRGHSLEVPVKQQKTPRADYESRVDSRSTRDTETVAFQGMRATQRMPTDNNGTLFQCPQLCYVYKFYARVIQEGGLDAP